MIWHAEYVFIKPFTMEISQSNSGAFKNIDQKNTSGIACVHDQVAYKFFRLCVNTSAFMHDLCRVKPHVPSFQETFKTAEQSFITSSADLVTAAVEYSKEH